MARYLFLGLSLAVWAVRVLGAASAQADERSAADLLPPSTVLYAEVRQPAQLIDGVLNHPVREKIESLDAVRNAYATKQFRQFKAILSHIETQLGKRWPELLKSFLGAGIAVGVDAKTGGVALLTRGQNEDAPREIVSTLVRLARQDAANNGRSDPIEEGTYRDIKAYGVDETRLAVIGSWVVVTNKADLGKQIIDRYLDGAGGTLAAKEQFQEVRQRSSEDAAAWGYADIAMLRSAGAAKDVFAGKAENPLAELLVGGILSVLQQTPYATATLHASEQGLRLEFETPYKPTWIPEARQHYFGPDGHGKAPAPLRVKDMVLSLSAYRDLSEMWMRAGDLFDERVNDGFAQADSALSTLFAGKDFGDDILGALAPELQLVVARQSFQAGEPQPAIKLPAFAAVFTLKDPQKMRADLRRTFQSMIGFLNVTGAMNGQPQLDFDSETDGDRQIVTASYVPEEGSDLNRLKINFNFSPSVAFVEDRFVVASSGALARELASQAKVAVPEGQVTNTSAVTEFQILRNILADNREQLVAQNMLKDGHSQEEAEQQIDGLLTLLGFFGNANLQLAVADQAIMLTLDMRLSE